MKHELIITVEVTTEDLKDVLCAAFEGGSNYWIGSVKRGCLPDEGTAEYFHEYPALGGTLEVREIGEDMPSLYLTREKLLAGITLAATHGHLTRMPGTEDWTIDVDAPAADTIIQYALFGKLLYG